MKSRKFILALLTIIVTLFAVQPQLHATSIIANLTTDDAFKLYISTDKTQNGTYIGEHQWWPDTMTYTLDLTPNVTNYIHIIGWDIYTVIASVLGDFTLSDTNFVFSNGTQKLLTNTTDWQVYTDGFGGGPATLTDQGANGSSPWGLRSGIDADARWIWTGGGYDFNTLLYFSAAVTPTSAVPEPSLMVLLGISIASVVGLKRWWKE